MYWVLITLILGKIGGPNDILFCEREWIVSPTGQWGSAFFLLGNNLLRENTANDRYAYARPIVALAR